MKRRDKTLLTTLFLLKLIMQLLTNQILKNILPLKKFFLFFKHHIICCQLKHYSSPVCKINFIDLNGHLYLNLALIMG